MKHLKYNRGRTNSEKDGSLTNPCPGRVFLLKLTTDENNVRAQPFAVRAAIYKLSERQNNESIPLFETVRIVFLRFLLWQFFF